MANLKVLLAQFALELNQKMRRLSQYELHFDEILKLIRNVASCIKLTHLHEPFRLKLSLF